MAWTTRPPDHRNCLNTTLLSRTSRSQIWLSPEPLGHQTTKTTSTQNCSHYWTGRTHICLSPESLGHHRTNYINTTLQTLNIAGTIHSAEKRRRRNQSNSLKSDVMLKKAHLPCRGHPSRWHPSRAALLRLGDIRLGRPSSVLGTSVSGGLPPSRGHPSRRHPSPRLGRPRPMAQKDVPGTKSHENEGPFRPGFSSQGHPSATPVCATRLGDVRLGLPSRGHPSRGHPSRGHPSGAHPSRAPPSRGQPSSEVKIIDFNHPSQGTSINY